MAPEAMPSTETLPRAAHSMAIHVSAAVAAAQCVFANASPARPLAENAEPALNPNQPTHNRAAPVIVSARLCGKIGSVPYPLRSPSMITHARPVTPALMWTTVPPAKSNIPSEASQPSGDHTQCAIGAYTHNDHSAMNSSIEENLMRSANAPVISAGVMMANIIWNIMNTDSGMVGAR